MLTKSIATDLTKFPYDDLASLMACIEKHRREKASLKHSQGRVLVYDWSHLEESIEAVVSCRMLWPHRLSLQLQRQPVGKRMCVQFPRFFAHRPISCMICSCFL